MCVCVFLKKLLMQQISFPYASFSSELCALKIYVFFAGAGVITSFYFRRVIGIFWTAIAVLTAIAFVYMPQGRLWNARVLPFYFLSLYMLGALAVAEVGWGVAQALRNYRQPDTNRPSEVLTDVADGLTYANPMFAFMLAVALLVPHIAAPGMDGPRGLLAFQAGVGSRPQPARRTRSTRRGGG